MRNEDRQKNLNKLQNKTKRSEEALKNACEGVKFSKKVEMSVFLGTFQGFLPQL